jgi:hypothetical protein
MPIYQHTPILVTRNISFGKVINAICWKIWRTKGCFYPWTSNVPLSTSCLLTYLGTFMV